MRRHWRQGDLSHDRCRRTFGATRALGADAITGPRSAAVASFRTLMHDGQRYFAEMRPDQEHNEEDAKYARHGH